MQYRLYLDEVGHANPSRGLNDSDLYLSLTGVIINKQYASNILFPNVEILKRDHCPTHLQDDPVVLHRTQIANRNYPFDSLRCPVMRESFDRDLLKILSDTEYVALTVVLDKSALRSMYFWPLHPYHYCVEVLLERYVKWLESRNCTGDIMAEGRSAREDNALQAQFAQFLNTGTRFVSAQRISAVITSKNIKFKKKEHNIAGLQLTEVIAHPSFKSMLANYRRQPPPPTFGTKIVQILHRSKYYRNRNGKIEGYGLKWLP